MANCLMDWSKVPGQAPAIVRISTVAVLGGEVANLAGPPVDLFHPNHGAGKGGRSDLNAAFAPLPNQGEEDEGRSQGLPNLAEQSVPERLVHPSSQNR